MSNDSPIVSGGYRQVISAEYARVSRFFISNPAMALTILYVFTSVIGLTYTVLLFNRFDITILSHLEIADFLLTALLQPVMFFYTLILIFIYWASHKLDAWLRSKSPRYARTSEWSVKPIIRVGPFMFYIIVSLSLLLLVIYTAADRSYNDFMAGKSQRFSVQTIYDIPVQSLQVKQLNNVNIVADTTKYLWLYSPENKEIYSVPHNNIALLKPLLKQPQAVIELLSEPVVVTD